VSYSNAGGSSTGTMPDNGAVIITPGTSSQTIPAGYHNGAGYVDGDSDLRAANILGGTTIFGVSGAAVEASGDATDARVLEGVSYSNAGGSSTGTMPDNGAVIITPGAAGQTIPAGYHNGAGLVAGDRDLVAANILSGTTIFGVSGAAIEASGNATDAQVLFWRTYSNSNGPSTGTMLNLGAMTIEPGSNGQAIPAGYHDGSGYVAGDADLVAENIRRGTTIFGVTGEAVIYDAPAPVLATGQTMSWSGDDDADLQMGVAWPVPRFTINGDGTVTDNLTDLVWLSDATCFGEIVWADAISAANQLNSGRCGLTDGSQAGDWRLPNLRELESLVAYQYFYPPLSNTAGTGQVAAGDPFTSFPNGVACWSSTAVAGSDTVHKIRFYRGETGSTSKNSAGHYGWPVRDK